MPILAFSIIIASSFSRPTYAAEASSSIGLAITPTNLAITAPASGGLVAGKQSIKLTSNSNYQTNYNLSLSSKGTNTSLLPTKTGNTTKLLTTTGTLTKPATALNNNEWGISLDGKSYIGLPSADSNPLQLMNGTLNNSSNNSNTTNTTTTKDITFATKTTEVTPADTYTINLVYTLTAEEILPAPTVDRTTPAAYQYGDTTNTKWTTSANGAPTTFNAKTITIQGSNFVPDATSVYLDINNNGREDNNESCTNVTVASNGNSLTCTIPDETTNKALDTTKDAVYNLVVSNGSQSTTKKNAFAYYASSICENANPNSDCQVDIDANMFPVRYTGNTTNPEWTIITQDEVDNEPGSWYNYENKQWANAVTVKPEALQNYKHIQATGEKNVTIPEDDILSYFTYIPRYAYEVMRPNAIDKYATEQNFAIKFEKATDTKKSPASSLTCNPYNNKSTAEEIANTKDYRTDCNIDRIYPTTTAKANQTTWATHPTFTWQYTKAINGFDKTTELNGIWVGKYETSGSTTQPTIKPNSKHIGSVSDIWGYYDIAKSMGKLDSNNAGGSNTTVSQNNNNLDSVSTHMLKNSEWGATTYLSASKYGAGVNGTQINSASDSGNDGNGGSSDGCTGYGPNANGDTATYTCATATDHQYQSTIGQLASTAGNPTGIYDMSGGAWEYVMGSRTTSDTGTSADFYLSNPVKPPYVDLYRTSAGFDAWPNWSGTSNEPWYSNDNCTWNTCAGQALNETKISQAVSSYDESWGGAYSYFPDSSNAWSVRGGYYDNGSYAGLFYSLANSGSTYEYSGFRVAVPAGI